jgi:acyl CoA:acetate/3-ketoacid CoA transferase beta subunit
MTIAASRELSNEDVCFVGIGAPSAACNLARLTHAPDLVLIYESGTIQTRPDVLPLSIGDGELCETALMTVSVPEMFAYWLQGGRISKGFLGGAQIDRYANINTTVIGPYDTPKVRLPGGGGAPEIAASCGEVFVTASHSPRTFVEQVDFVSVPTRDSARAVAAGGRRQLRRRVGSTGPAAGSLGSGSAGSTNVTSGAARVPPRLRRRVPSTNHPAPGSRRRSRVSTEALARSARVEPSAITGWGRHSRSLWNRLQGFPPAPVPGSYPW